MKKFLIPIFSVLFISQLSAQKEFWFELGAKGGVGLSFLTNKNIFDDNNYTYKMTLSNTLGAKFAANFGPTHSIMVEGLLSNLGQDFNYRLVAGDNELKEEIDFKAIDLALLYRATIQRSYVEIGPVYSKLRSVKYSSEADATKYFEDNYLSGLLGFGGYLGGAETFSVGMGLRFHYTFADLVNERGQAAGYPNPVKVLPYPSVEPSHFAWAEVMFELNFGVGHFAKTSCSERFKRMRRR
ncbi:MAG: hypothetical protein GC192_03090 [Bacteroidetes bacterium]|nr:hypothetical protein [Bacteroidota bacterium]